MEEKKLYNAVRKIITLADGRQIEIETGKLAKQADGSVVVKMGDTMLLGTVVAAKDAKPDTDFMPLQVEYKEKYAAVGRFPGGFMKREARANDSEVPVARVMWKAMPNLTTGVECWITAGGAHHTVLSYDVTAEQMRDWARIMDIEYVHIGADTTVESLEHDLFLSDLAWKLK